MSNAGTLPQVGQKDGNPDHPDTGPTVTIKVNNIDRQIHRGRQTVEAIKNVGNVPLADDLEEVVSGKLVPLAG